VEPFPRDERHRSGLDGMIFVPYPKLGSAVHHDVDFVFMMGGLRIGRAGGELVQPHAQVRPSKELEIQLTGTLAMLSKLVEGSHQGIRRGRRGDPLLDGPDPNCPSPVLSRDVLPAHAIALRYRAGTFRGRSRGGAP
jgi:hypothetical protein